MVVPGVLRTSTERIFPLSFGREAVVPTNFLFVELVQKGLYVYPGNVFHRKMRIAFESAWIVAHHRFPLRLRDRVLPQIKRLADGNMVGGYLAAERFCIRIW